MRITENLIHLDSYLIVYRIKFKYTDMLQISFLESVNISYPQDFPYLFTQELKSNPISIQNYHFTYVPYLDLFHIIEEETETHFFFGVLSSLHNVFFTPNLYMEKSIKQYMDLHNLKSSKILLSDSNLLFMLKEILPPKYPITYQLSEYGPYVIFYNHTPIYLTQCYLDPFNRYLHFFNPDSFQGEGFYYTCSIKGTPTQPIKDSILSILDNLSK